MKFNHFRSFAILMLYTIMTFLFVNEILLFLYGFPLNALKSYTPNSLSGARAIRPAKFGAFFFGAALALWNVIILFKFLKARGFYKHKLAFVISLILIFLYLYLLGAVYLFPIVPF
jgi:hypothetical protein